ncbi:MAG: hypothetical protein ACYC3Q_10085 [Gemmatimonadaceae bacterium]
MIKQLPNLSRQLLQLHDIQRAPKNLESVSKGDEVIPHFLPRSGEQHLSGRRLLNECCDSSAGGIELLSVLARCVHEHMKLLVIKQQRIAGGEKSGKWIGRRGSNCRE